MGTIGPTNESYYIPSRMCGIVIGKGGKNIKNIEQSYSVKATVLPGKLNDLKVLQIFGMKRNIEMAALGIETILRMRNAKLQKITIPTNIAQHQDQNPRTGTEDIGIASETTTDILDAETQIPQIHTHLPGILEYSVFSPISIPKSSSPSPQVFLTSPKLNPVVQSPPPPTPPLPSFECEVCFETFFINDGCLLCESPSSSSIEKEESKHKICVDCIRGFAHSAITESSVAFGGLGLPCIEPECNNIFPLTSFEIYLCDEDYMPLKLRLQEQCLADAGFEDLVTCPKCGFKACVPFTESFYNCPCGRQQCRYCPRLFDDKHFDKTCKELDDEEVQQNSERKLEPKLSEAVIRRCHKCRIAFVKLEGCNKMTCRCGGMQCYVCQQKDINYEHFCQCGDTQQQHGQCQHCHKNCRLWENSDELDQLKINQLRQEL
uniref:RING-type domain-containing protein n=1 Tax=Panagrolaimus davidi TaxID=227884 RepID=A0A914PAX9_9BILA